MPSIGIGSFNQEARLRTAVTGIVVSACAYSILALVSVNGGQASQPQQVVISTLDEIGRDVALAPCKDKERLNGVRDLFLKLGAREDELIVERLDGVENLVLRKKGTAAGTIVVGAHYDKVADGCGAIDNWTGIVALAHVFRSLKDYPFEKSVVFVAFGQEERGLLGSKAMVKAIAKEEVDSYCAMINIDSLGMGRLDVVENVSSDSLLKRAIDLAKRVKLPVGRFTLARADTDSSSFVRRKIPAVTITGISNEWEGTLHTGNDQVKRVDVPSVYAGYWFALALIAELQTFPCDISRK